MSGSRYRGSWCRCNVFAAMTNGGRFMYHAICGFTVSLGIPRPWKLASHVQLIGGTVLTDGHRGNARLQGLQEFVLDGSDTNCQFPSPASSYCPDPTQTLSHCHAFSSRTFSSRYVHLVRAVPAPLTRSDSRDTSRETIQPFLLYRCRCTDLVHWRHSPSSRFQPRRLFRLSSVCRCR